MANNNQDINLDLTLTLASPNQGNAPVDAHAPVDNVHAPVEAHAPNDQVNRAPIARRGVLNADDAKVCMACGNMNTPLWRKGPNGPQTLCNACGLKHARTLRRAAQ
ncbi:hypothetical protein ABFX02_12G045700 [Erythranthe guttata]